LACFALISVAIVLLQRLPPLADTHGKEISAQDRTANERLAEMLPRPPRESGIQSVAKSSIAEGEAKVAVDGTNYTKLELKDAVASANDMASVINSYLIGLCLIVGFLYKNTFETRKVDLRASLSLGFFCICVAVCAYNGYELRYRGVDLLSSSSAASQAMLAAADKGPLDELIKNHAEALVAAALATLAAVLVAFGERSDDAITIERVK
jgi:hypothetical protein